MFKFKYENNRSCFILYVLNTLFVISISLVIIYLFRFHIAASFYRLAAIVIISAIFFYPSYWLLFGFIRPRLEHYPLKNSITLFVLCFILGLLAIIIICKTDPVFHTLEIIATGDKNIDAKGSEIWVIKRGRYAKDKLNSPFLDEFLMIGLWEKRKTALVSHQKQPSKLKWQGKLGCNSYLYLLKHPWSGIVEVIWDENSEKIDLYSEKREHHKIVVPQKQYTSDKILAAGAFSIVFTVISFVSCIFILSITNSPGLSSLIATDTATWMLFIVLGAIIIRLAIFYIIIPTPAMNHDEADYLLRAYYLSEAGHISKGWRGLGGRTPGIEFFYAFLFKLFGVSVLVARVGNIAISIMTLLPVFIIGKHFKGTECGLLSTALAALYPNLIAYSNSLWSETLYIFFFLSGLAFLTSYTVKAKGWKLPVAGVIFALSALTREVGIIFPVFLFGWLVWILSKQSDSSVSKSFLRLLFFYIPLILTILPWTLYINKHSDHFILLSNTSYLNLYKGNDLDSSGKTISEPESIKAYNSLGKTISERESAARKIALNKIAEQMPWWAFYKLKSEIPDLFRPNCTTVDLLLKTLSGEQERWSYKFTHAAFNNAWLLISTVAIMVGCYLIVAILGVGGLIIMQNRIVKSLLIISIISQIFPAIITFADPRYRLSTMALLIIGAASFLIEGRNAWNSASYLRRSVMIVAMISMFLIIASRYSSLL